MKKKILKISSYIITILITCLVYKLISTHILNSSFSIREKQLKVLYENNAKTEKFLDSMVKWYSDTYDRRGHDQAYLSFYKKNKRFIRKIRNSERINCSDIESFKKMVSEYDKDFNLELYDCDFLSNNTSIEILISELLFYNMEKVEEKVEELIFHHLQVDGLSLYLLEKTYKNENEILLKVKQEYFLSNTKCPYVINDNDTIFPDNDNKLNKNIYYIKVKNPRIGKNNINLIYHNESWGGKGDFNVSLEYKVE